MLASVDDENRPTATFLDVKIQTVSTVLNLNFLLYFLVLTLFSLDFADPDYQPQVEEMEALYNEPTPSELDSSFEVSDAE